MLKKLTETGLIYGGDYNPEQWDRSVWDEDVVLMKRAGVNIVTVGVFSWAKYQPEEDQFEFDWMDDLLELLHTNGIGVCMATATATPPIWLVRKYPEVLPVTADGVRLEHGARQHFTPNSSVFCDYAEKLVQALADRYGSHPAVKLWHIGNEPACHMQASYGEADAKAFRVWLKNRYQTIEALNDAWTSSFWGQLYSDFEQVNPPRSAPYDINPTMKLDYKRFMSDSWLRLYQMESKLLRSATPQIPQTVNFIGLYPSIDQFSWADSVDIASVDVYPDPREHLYGFPEAYDLTRTVNKGEPFLLMEQTASFVQWRPYNDLRRPGVLKSQSLQALARGSNGVMYFQWRQSKGGGERFHGAMLPHSGCESRVFQEVCEFGELLKKLQPIYDTKVEASVALLFDWSNWWAFEDNTIPWKHLGVMEIFQAYYQSLYEAKIVVDIVTPEWDLSKYKAVILPGLHLISNKGRRRLLDYAKEGGIVIGSALSGYVDAFNQVLSGGYPGDLVELFGLKVDEWIPYPKGVDENGVIHNGQRLPVDRLAESLILKGGKNIASFDGDFIKGKPAVVRNEYGKGKGFYLGAHFRKDDLKNILLPILAELDIRCPLDLSESVEWVVRSNSEKRYLFLIQHGTASVRVPLGDFSGKSLISGKNLKGEVLLDAFGVEVMELR